MRKCKKCGAVKVLENFYISQKGLVRRECKACSNEISRRTYRKNPEKVIARIKKNYKPGVSRRHYLIRTYGLSEQEYQKMLVAQDGRCAICKEKEVHNNKILCVDHCHKTKKIRGLVCNRCNLLLGRAKDSPIICRLAAAYLEKANASEPQEDIDDGAYV